MTTLSFAGINTKQYSFNTPSSEWIVEHNLDYLPAVEACTYYNGALVKIIPSAVEHTAVGTVVVKWSSDRTGFVTISSSAIGAADELPIAPPADQYFNQVVGLLHMNSDFTDVKDHHVFADGNVSIVNNIFRFGSGSALFDGTNSMLSIVNSNLTPSSDFTFNTGDFTIETWIRPTALPGSGLQSPVWTNSPPAGTEFGSTTFGATLMPSGVIRIQSAFVEFLLGTIAVPLNNWTHIAVSRVSGTMRLFINGTLDVSAVVANDFSSVLDFKIGAYQTTIDNQHYAGYVDDFRITKGVGRYVSNFVAPEKEFANNL